MFKKIIYNLNKIFVFILYIIQLPFKESWNFLKSSWKFAENNSKTDFKWAVTFFAFGTVMLAMNRFFEAKVLLIASVITYVKAQWVSGKFWYEYKDKKRKLLIEELGGENNGDN